MRAFASASGGANFPSVTTVTVICAMPGTERQASALQRSAKSDGNFAALSGFVPIPIPLSLVRIDRRPVSAAPVAPSDFQPNIGQSTLRSRTLVDLGGLELLKACARLDATEIGEPHAAQTNSMSLCAFTSPTRTMCAVPQE